MRLGRVAGHGRPHRTANQRPSREEAAGSSPGHSQERKQPFAARCCSPRRPPCRSRGVARWHAGPHQARIEVYSETAPPFHRQGSTVNWTCDAELWVDGGSAGPVDQQH